jgi:hypothetical protein
MFIAREFKQRTAIVLCVIAALCVSNEPRSAHGAAGDVSFRVASGTVSAQSAGLATSLDLFIDVDTLSNVEANSWSAGLRIVAEGGSRGGVTFAPPMRVADLPNLSAASLFPFRDFDRDYQGMSYGVLGNTAEEMVASAIYIEPESMAAPGVTSVGNLVVPNGSGLVALPLFVAAETYGVFRIEVVSDGLQTGVGYATGDDVPNDVALRSMSSHTRGVLRVMGDLPGDANGDGLVDGYDFNVWLLHRTSSEVGPTRGDFNLDGSVDGADFSVWYEHRFRQSAPASAVPEPQMLGVGIVLLMVWRRGVA